MALTPKDVRDKRFTPVRLREGYDMAEVDSFLDDVEAELVRLLEENEALRTDAGSAPAERSPEPAGAGAAPTTTTSGAAARLLEIATRNAEELAAETRDQADRMLAAARSESERLATEAKDRAERVEGGARSRAEELDSETAERRAQLLASLDRQRETLSKEVDDLRAFEREYRGRLKAYFEQQLAALDAGPVDGSSSTGSASPAEPAPTPPPTRLSSLLAEQE